MANFINTSLDIIRRHKQPRRPHLHARWGDVGITAPIDGAWSQFHNPHLKGKKIYGPGYVAGVSSTANNDNKEVMLLDADEWTSEDEEEKRKEKEKEKERSASKARRLTRILLPSSINTPTKKTDELDKEKPPVEFQYKPVCPDYAQEIAQKLDMEAKPHFRYVPASEKYFKELIIDSPKAEDGTDDKAVYEGVEGNNYYKTIPRRPTKQRSHSCDPCVGTDAEFRQIPQSNKDEQVVDGNKPSISPRTPPLGIMPRKATSSSNNSASGGERSSNTHHRDQSRGRIKHSQTFPQNIVVQRSQSVLSKPRRRTMILDMVGDQDDLW
ncbi:hypothetical protein BGW36DRAFT_123924 [Talaromyces proteolyticus]|uniref:Uncharacterized protein n=1 Tax=Talaromyces proteolyticus TaxID=1131652 RepID=A0AAD4KV45_9EURO|nr:uncharacterized protein BGW36DRAFT_123924 [Talaromyces proteolyticus]KAH8700158.1 hypothetical protein BGW36DRAFT_123924 [Talaromyces proteolyticus]